MKLELLSAPDGDAIATIESKGRHGVIVEGPSAFEASTLVNAARPPLKSKLGREASPDEVVESLLAGEAADRLRKAE